MSARRARALLCAALLALVGCTLDTDAPAPYTEAATAPSPCGSTEALLPRLLDFLRSGQAEPLRVVVEGRFRPEVADASPGAATRPTVRSLLDAVLRLLKGLGVEKTRAVTSAAATSRALDEIQPLIVALAEVVEGQRDGMPRWPAVEAASSLFVRCDADALLTALERLLRLPAPEGGGERWFAALLRDLVVLLEDPTLGPFVDGFQQSGARGRPAIVGLVNQILGFVIEDDFAAGRVRTLLASVVYPAVSAELRTKIERLLTRVEQATTPGAGILPPLQISLRCLAAKPDARDALVSLVVDLALLPDLGIRGLLRSATAVVEADDGRQLADFTADLLGTLRREPVARDEVFAAAAVVLAKPDVEAVVPVIRRAFQDGVPSELLSAFSTFLAGCGRGAP